MASRTTHEHPLVSDALIDLAQRTGTAEIVAWLDQVKHDDGQAKHIEPELTTEEYLALVDAESDYLLPSGPGKWVSVHADTGTASSDREHSSAVISSLIAKSFLAWDDDVEGALVVTEHGTGASDRHSRAIRK